MLLARAVIVAPDLLLLDEPTNHLDIGRIGALERLLAALPGDCAVVSASHDRAFLDDVTNRTLFLRPEDSVDFSLPYSRALQALKERDASRDRQFENDMRKVRGLRQQATKLKNIGTDLGGAVKGFKGAMKEGGETDAAEAGDGEPAQLEQASAETAVEREAVETKRDSA